MPTRNLKLGLRENWQQFTLLVIVNAFVDRLTILSGLVVITTMYETLRPAEPT